jgi:hypothetical protein
MMVQVHGLDKGQVEKGITTVAASALTGDLVGTGLVDPGKGLIRPGHKFFVFCKVLGKI